MIHVDLSHLIIKLVRKEYKEIKYWDYREAHVKTVLFDFSSGDDICDGKTLLGLLIDQIDDKNISRNHVTFQVITDDGSLVFRFDDDQVIVGLGVVEGDW